MSTSSDDDFEERVPSAPRKIRKKVEETESEEDAPSEDEEEQGVEKDALQPKKTKQFREWQILKEFNRADPDYNSEDVNEEIYQIARDEITPTINSNVLRIIKPKPSSDLNIWRFKNSRELKSINATVREYNCPLAHRCSCKVSIRVARNPTNVVLSIAGHHRIESHTEKDTKQLTLSQRAEIAKMVRAQPSSNSRQIRRALQESRKQKRIPLQRRRAIAKRVAAEQRVVLEEQGLSLSCDPTFGSLSKLCDALFLEELMKRYVFVIPILSGSD